MMVAFTGVQGVGQSFMDWSFHYLHGKETFWNLRTGQIPLVADPVTEKNAHSHLKNHPEGLDQTLLFIDSASQTSGEEIITFHPYIHGAKHQRDTLKLYTDMINLLSDRSVKIVVIKQTKPYPYFSSERNEIYDNSEESKETELWLGKKLSTIAKTREEISLKMIGNKKKWLEEVDRTHKSLARKFVLSVSDQEWAEDTELVMINILDRLKIKINHDRLTAWRPIMKVWKSKINKLIDWYEKDIPTITSAIVKKEHLDLEDFNLNLEKEAAIMAYLMRDYGRRLLLTTKEFPKNTKDLHRFLK